MQPTDQSLNNISSVADLEQMLNSEPVKQDISSEVERTEEPVVINNTTPKAEVPEVSPSLVAEETQPVVQEVKAVVKDETKPTKFTPPALEAELASDAERDLREGKTEQVENATLSAMRDLVENSSKANEANARIVELLENLTVDPYAVDILKSNEADPIELFNQVELVGNTFVSHNSFPVIALKSGYKAEMSALSTNDKIEIRNVQGSPLDQATKLLRIIYKHIKETSVGKMSYDKFLKVTAEDDYETLLYGLYAATFPNATEYELKCPHCGEAIKLPLYPSQLIEVVDKEKAGKYVQEVLSGYNRGEEFLKESMVQRPTRIVLPKSKAIVSIITPTLYQMIENLKLIEEQRKYYNPELIAIAKMVGNIAIVDVEKLQRDRTLQYVGIEARDHLEFMSKRLCGEDMKALRYAVSDRMRAYGVSYRIPDFTCPSSSCSKTISKIDVDMVNVLFFGILGEI